MKALNVRETPWAPQLRGSYATLESQLPAVVESQFKLWQRRVEQGSDEFLPHRFIFTVECDRMERRSDGVTAICDPPETLTFLVCADTGQDAAKRIKAELTTHGYKPEEWSFCTNQGPLVAFNG